MEAVLVALSILGLLILVATYGFGLVFPQRRGQFEQSWLFAFAPLVFGLVGLLALAIILLVQNPQPITPAIASNSAVVLFNLYNGYRSVDAFFRRRRRS